MTTTHGLTRTKERTGYNTSTAARFIENAIQRGKMPTAMPTRERRYLQQQEAKEGCNALYYNGFCFIVSTEGYCVTMYPAPKWFGKKPHYDGKERIRNIKRYARNYFDTVNEGVMNYGFC